MGGAFFPLFELRGLPAFAANFEETAQALREGFELPPEIVVDLFLRARDFEAGRDFEAPLEVRRVGDEIATLEVTRAALAFLRTGERGAVPVLSISCTAPLIDLVCMIEPFSLPSREFCSSRARPPSINMPYPFSSM